jgi:hypothetical protein
MRRPVTAVGSLSPDPDCLNHLDSDGWLDHHAPGWYGYGLRAVGGDHRAAGEDPGAEPDRCSDTELLVSAPDALRGLVAAVGAYGRLGVVRLLWLEPDAPVRPHIDTLAPGVSRLHVPIVTNPGAVLMIGAQPWHLAYGTVWSVDTGVSHYPVNAGVTARVHLVANVWDA